MDEDLGKLISVHRSGLFGYWWCFLLSGCLVTISLIFWAARGQRAENDDALVVIAGVTLVLAVFPLVIAWYFSKNEARAHERGFIYITRRRRITANWADVGEFYKMSMTVVANGMPTPAQHRFSVCLNDGTIVRFSPRLENLENLGMILLSVAEMRHCPIRSGVPYAFSRKAAQHSKSTKQEIL